MQNTKKGALSVREIVLNILCAEVVQLMSNRPLHLIKQHLKKENRPINKNLYIKYDSHG